MESLLSTIQKDLLMMSFSDAPGRESSQSFHFRLAVKMTTVVALVNSLWTQKSVVLHFLVLRHSCQLSLLCRSLHRQQQQSKWQSEPRDVGKDEAKPEINKLVPCTCTQTAHKTNKNTHHHDNDRTSKSHPLLSS